MYGLLECDNFMGEKVTDLTLQAMDKLCLLHLIFAHTTSCYRFVGECARKQEGPIDLKKGKNQQKETS